MSELTVSRVGLAKGDIESGKLGETVTAGQYVRLNTSSGKWELGNASNTAESRMGGIALNGGISGEGVDVLRRGVVDLGNAFTSMGYDDIVYLSNSDGVLGDAQGTVERIVGSTVPGLGSKTPDKLLRVEMND